MAASCIQNVITGRGLVYTSDANANATLAFELTSRVNISNANANASAYHAFLAFAFFV